MKFLGSFGLIMVADWQTAVHETMELPTQTSLNKFVSPYTGCSIQGTKLQLSCSIPGCEELSQNIASLAPSDTTTKKTV